MGERYAKLLRTLNAALPYAIVLAFCFYMLLNQATWLTEDAYIFLRYAKNLANGHGFVFNPGGERVEGATSAPYLFSVAFLLKLGLDEMAPRLVGIFYTCLSACFIVWFSRRVGAPVLLGVLTAIVLAYTALPFLAMAGYDLPLAFFFSLATCGFTLLAFTHPNRLQEQNAKTPSRHDSGIPPPPVARSATPHAGSGGGDGGEGFEGHPSSGDSFLRKDRQLLSITRWFGISAVLLAMSRPDAYFLVIPAVVLVLVKLGRQRSTWTTLLVCGCFLLTYHGIKRLYFGYWLPNTFYVKSGGDWFYPEAFYWFTGQFLRTYGIATALGVFAVVALWLRRKLTILYLLVPISFLASWAITDQEMNLEARFQMPALPWLLMPPIVLAGVLARHALSTPNVPRRHARWRSGINPASWVVGALAILCYGAYLQSNTRLNRTLKPWAMPEKLAVFSRIGKSLNKYKSEDYGLISTEAGLMPYYTDWHTLDSHGLNDTFVAHGELTEAYMDSFRPLVIEIHDVQVRYPGWANMLVTMKAYVESRRFTEVWHWPTPKGEDTYRFFVDLSHPMGPTVRDEILFQVGANGVIGPYHEPGRRH